MKLRNILGAILLTGLASTACSTDTGSSTDFHSEGVLGFAPPIEFGTAVAGQVASPQLDVWALRLKAGDKLRLTETVTSGDLAPDIVLFLGNSRNHISSDDFEVNGNTLRKDYSTEFDGTYYIVVRGYQNQGAGAYSLSAECLGGPCAGEVPPPPVVELDDDEKYQCVRNARECAMDRLPQYNGAVGPVRAKQLFDTCLAEGTIDSWQSDIDVSCAPACVGDDEEYICNAVIGLLPWMADQSAECLDEYNLCYEECTHSAWGGYPESLIDGPEAVCATGEAAFNGSCPDVKELEVCGGQWASDSCEACYIRCHQRTGAWVDDLDTICDEDCECEPSEDFWY